MNEAQKQRAVDLIDVTKTYRLDAEECAMQMAALLQELADAPEPDPVARVTGYYAGYLTIATVDGRVLPAGTALFTAQPARADILDICDALKIGAEARTETVIIESIGKIGRASCRERVSSPV